MNVAVLMGGRSPEHEVSLASAAQVLQHVDRRRWTVWPCLLERDGSWRVARRPLAAGEAWSGATGASPADLLQPPMRPGRALDWLLDEAQVDVVFPVLHGPFGEDGTVQALCELSDVACVGSGCAASAVAIDKLRARQVFVAGGVPVAPIYEPSVGQPVAGNGVRQVFAELEQAVGTPAFVKVDTSGSTVGVARVTTAEELGAFFAGFGGRFRRWFAEQAVAGEELTVAVVGNTGERVGSGREPVALPPVGIYPVDDDWFTNDAKYRPGATEEIVPPRGLSEAAIVEVQRLAVRCHELLVCDGVSRTDMIMTATGPIVLETNTIPGLTSNSLLPRAAAAAGLSFAQLLDRLLELALHRAPGRAPSVHQPAGGPADNDPRSRPIGQDRSISQNQSSSHLPSGPNQAGPQAQGGDPTLPGAANGAPDA